MADISRTTEVQFSWIIVDIQFAYSWIQWAYIVFWLCCWFAPRKWVILAPGAFVPLSHTLAIRHITKGLSLGRRYIRNVDIGFYKIFAHIMLDFLAARLIVHEHVICVPLYWRVFCNSVWTGILSVIFISRGERIIQAFLFFRRRSKAWSQSRFIWKSLARLW